jgi:ABC-2 type transport system permease protein
MNMNEATLDAPELKVRSAVAKVPLAKVLLALIRREFWEHRALWMVPALLSILVFIGASFIRVVADNHGLHVEPFPWRSGGEGALTPEQSNVGVAMLMLLDWAMTAPLFIASSIVIFFYLLQCLFDERKDRSILFWKSLPVSDGTTIASKLLVGIVVVPIGVFLLALVDHLLISLVVSARVAVGPQHHYPLLWDTVAWVKTEAFMFLCVMATMLWVFPIAAYLLLVSAWARRNVFLWAILPPVLIALVEQAFGTHFLNYVFFRPIPGIWGRWDDGVTHAIITTNDGVKLPFLPSILDGVSLGAFFSNSRLWIGLVVGAVLTYCAVRIRRYRDDT